MPMERTRKEHRVKLSNLRLWGVFWLALSGFLIAPGSPVWGQNPPSRQDRPALYDFGMGMCLSCLEMEKILTTVKSKYGDQVEVRLLYADKDKELFSRYKIMLVPTQVFLDASGKEIDRHLGLFPEMDLVKKLKELQFIKD